MHTSMRRRIAVIPVIVLGLLLVSTVFFASHSAALEVSECQRQTALLNYRSELLTAYKKKEDKKFNAVRNRWAVRVAYASQWLTTDAERARDSLYKYDSLHAKTNKELTKQIAKYQSLTASPLGCGNEDKARLTQMLAEVKGMQNNKAVGGNALIKQYKDAESAFEKKDFKKTNEKLIKSMRKEKSKNPTPKYPELTVKDSVI